MTILTAGGSFATAYQSITEATIVSIREQSESEFIKALKNATTVIHNASTIAHQDPETLLDRNFDFTRYVVKILEEVNPGVNFINISSMSILDPANSSLYGNVVTMSPYAYSKYLGETYALRSNLKNAKSVRFSTLFYGDPGKDGISKLIHDAVTHKSITLYNEGVAKRNILPLEVAAQYVARLTETNAAKGGTYTFAAPSATSFAQIAAIISQKLPETSVSYLESPNAPSVLHDFSNSRADVEDIPFSIEYYIDEYIRSLHP